MGLDISFRRISCLLVVGLIFLTVSALANASAALSFPYTQVTEVAKSPVVWDPTRGAGVQTITKTCAAANSCSVKPATQWIKRGVTGIGKFAKKLVNPWATAAMIAGGWVWDSANEWWDKNFSVYGWMWSNHLTNKSEGPLMSRDEAIKNSYDSMLLYYSADGASKSGTATDTETSYVQRYWVWRYCPTSSDPGKKCGIASDIAVRATRTNTPEEFEVVAGEQDIWDAFVGHSDQANSWQMPTNDGQAINPWQDLFPDAAPAVEPDPLPEVSPSDAALLDLLKQGLLQSTDPLAPHYVSAAELARLQALAQQMDDALNQKAEDALNAMKQPITQQQYDESNSRDRAEFANALPDPNFLPDVEDNQNSEIDIINETPELPTGPDLTNLWSFSTGTCNGFTLPASVAGRSYSITVDKQCDYYPEFNAALNFMLYLLTAFQIFNIYHRAMLRG